jgi:hypothetical protein
MFRRRWLCDLVGVDVETIDPPTAVSEILQEKFGCPMLILVARHLAARRSAKLG